MKKAKQEIVGRKGPEQVKPQDFKVLTIPYRIVTAEEKQAKRKP